MEKTYDMLEQKVAVAFGHPQARTVEERRTTINGLIEFKSAEREELVSRQIRYSRSKEEIRQLVERLRIQLTRSCSDFQGSNRIAAQSLGGNAVGRIVGRTAANAGNDRKTAKCARLGIPRRDIAHGKGGSSLQNNLVVSSLSAFAIAKFGLFPRR